MKKFLLLTILNLLSISLIEAQVGINTVNPLGVFHIDPLKDTNASGSSGSNDDIIITNDGKMGVGTLNPKSNLDINGKIRISDGTEQNGYTFVSDANGIGSWQPLPSPLAVAMGGFDSTSNNIFLIQNNNSLTGPEKWFYTKSYIDVNPGKQLIASTLYTALGGDLSSLPNSFFYNATYSLSTSSSAFLSPEYILNTGGGRFITLSNNYPNISECNSGFWAVNNSTSAPIRLFIWVKVYFSTSVNAPNAFFTKLASNYWWENVISISPIDEDF